MPRTLPALILAVVLLSACGSVVSSPSLAHSTSPAPSTSPAQSAGLEPSPGLIPPPTAAPSDEPTVDPGFPSPDVPPLVYDWSKFPRLPTPILLAGRASVKAVAVAGCVTRFYEPRNDEFGRTTQSDPVCLTGPLPRSAPLVAAAGALLIVRAPDGYTLGAEVIDGAVGYAIVSSSRLIPPRIDGVGLDGTSELTRQMGFDLLEIQFAAPTEPGDYLINVAAQLGGVDRIYREFDTSFLFLLRVVAG